MAIMRDCHTRLVQQGVLDGLIGHAENSVMFPSRTKIAVEQAVIKMRIILLFQLSRKATIGFTLAARRAGM